MLVWLLHHFAPLAERMEQAAAGDSRVFLTARTALAAMTSFIAALVFGPPAIRWLQARFRERIDSASEKLNELHADKQQTPTMGGLFIVASIVTAVLLWGDLTSTYIQIGLFVTVTFGALGAADDWIKLRTTRRGLTVKQKLAAQIGLALVAGVWLYSEQMTKPGGLDLVWPFGNYGVTLGAGFAAWAVFVLVGSSNGVNLTDGLDGLASGCMVFAGASFVGITYLAGHALMADYLSIPWIAGSGELAIVMGALVGSMLGFLWFNCYPAQVFMGDTGSLPLGALLGLAALVTRQEVLLIIVGGVFVIETLSVIAQVGCFKMTGQRLIACSPLHNHFLFKGQHEIKIVTRFWIGSALLALVAVASLKIH
ncbi:Phospho-N-acetylmuramoyl-pentapeptide-transferase MraY [Maioricimonas rarisocia]|uniref:Phospho-N-acetylmuramoyl-pentapeptide-transferase n=1 Tax=Maioricimonas rarisocia TaxID=2528026 RepID=A0A517Z1X8_9PLAN|nr:phospho-N-acetylmuramoyl-pentapeptide-transferase [Maioricimonas rarisocia]QDU36465.1 Phospho-N-acetylmuramoyl-pentapeptide-transferase MraY [Maioricimonas rarisocia]